MFTSRTAESYDPGEYNWGVEGLAEREGAWVPRPEFEPTRDPKPWKCPDCDLRAARRDGAHGYVWSPRDRNRNRILIGFRDDLAGSSDLGGDVKAHAEFWLSTLSDQDATPAEVEHARRVLTLLTTLTNGA